MTPEPGRAAPGLPWPSPYRHEETRHDDRHRTPNP